MGCFGGGFDGKSEKRELILVKILEFCLPLPFCREITAESFIVIQINKVGF